MEPRSPVTAAPSRPLAVTIVAGWFGAGKTHLIESLLAERPGRIAVVHAGAAPETIQAWGTVAVEEELVHCSEDRCPCCAVRVDLVVAARDLAQRRHRPDHLVIEVGGDTDVTAVLQTFLRDPDLNRDTEVDGVVTVIDVASIAHLVSGAGLAVHHRIHDHVALADRLVLNHTDRVTERAAQQLAWTLHFANPRARVVERGDAELGPMLLDTGGFTAQGIATDRRTPAAAGATSGAPTVVRLCVAGPLDRTALSSWMDHLHHIHGTDLLRIQGVLALAGEERRWVARGVRTTLELDDGTPWADGEVRTSRLWLVGRELDPADLSSRLVRCVSGGP